MPVNRARDRQPRRARRRADAGPRMRAPNWGARADPRAATTVNAAAGGYLQAVEEDRLMQLADEHDLLLRLEQRIGDFVIEREPLALVRCANLEPHVAERLHNCIRLGPERTRYPDVERGIMELTDLGVRALSPGINDPTTAVVCVDRVTQVLAVLAAREFPATLRAGRAAAYA